MRRFNSNPHTQDTALNGARVLGSFPKRVWAAESPGAKRTCQRAGAWIRVLMAVP